MVGNLLLIRNIELEEVPDASLEEKSPLEGVHCPRSISQPRSLLYIYRISRLPMGTRTVHVELGVLHGGAEVDATLLLAPEADGRWLLVQADAKALQLVLYQLLVREGLQAVQHDQDQVARARRGNNLATKGISDVFS